MNRIKYFAFLVMILSSSIVFAGNPHGHWSFPGESISAHLNGHHKISTANMTYEQMLYLHDKLHVEEERAKYGNRQIVTTARQPVTRTFFFNRFRR